MSIRSITLPVDVPAAESLVAYRNVFLVAVGLLVAILVIAQFLPGREKALALQAERRAEMSESGSAAAMADHAVHEVA